MSSFDEAIRLYGDSLSGGRRIHVSKSEIQELKPVDGLAPDDKPPGLWWAIDGDWIKAALSMNIGLGPYIYELTIDTPSILQISTVEQFDALCDEYGCESKLSILFDALCDEYERKLDALVSSVFEFNDRIEAIDWPRLSLKYKGIEITPMISDRRFTTWYYGWDCESGIVWDISAVKAIRLAAIYSSCEKRFVAID